ncbi:MAG: bifunctional phosphoribosylaminoimidazolecarboxamide formyltransferase/IMP cyclohydrolase [Deltaproteobacteria bacterium]|nr:bifunctional phosphoribosylaminoimidazolecarboxamide formyltransferase/IMP cyclohydrolase [Deltaproteobacteria bacterium]
MKNHLQKALISVWDKTGLEKICPLLQRLGVQIYCTGGTAKFITNLGITVTPIETLTGVAEMMDGRVKTLHPKIFGGILARREVANDLEDAKKHDIPLFDLVIVNLYPFWEHLGESLDQQSSFIDIGGPSLIRAAAKNCHSVVVSSGPEDYDSLCAELEGNQGSTTAQFRQRMAALAFQRTSQYDSLIAEQWATNRTFPTHINLAPQVDLRYGENPHQKAVWTGKPLWQTLQGKELSYNNLLDAEAALRIVEDFDVPAVAIVKHNNPCGVAAEQSSRPSRVSLFERALACDAKSAFGGIVAFNGCVDEHFAEATAGVFLEVVIARRYTDRARELFAKKKNLRLIEWPKPKISSFDIRPALGGWLLQQTDTEQESSLTTVTTAQVPDERMADLKFAWLVCKHVRSNAIVIAKEGATLGIGAGQMSRVDSVSLAIQKYLAQPLRGAVLASDAFFPFRDNIDLLGGQQIAAIIQPGGSKQDAEVIKACNELGIAMVFTGRRHFRH